MSQSAIVRSCAVRPRPLPTGARSAAQVAPSLGLAWATCVTQHLFLSRCPAAAAVANDEDSGPGDGSRTGRTGRGCAPQPLLRSIQARRQAGLRHCCECPCCCACSSVLEDQGTCPSQKHTVGMRRPAGMSAWHRSACA